MSSNVVGIIDPLQLSYEHIIISNLAYEATGVREIRHLLKVTQIIRGRPLI